MRRFQAWLVAAMVTVGGCGGAQTAGKDPKAPARVLLVQIDGLSAALLEAYLARPASQSEDRALHRWLGVSASGAAQHYRKALSSRRTQAPLPALAQVTAASLLTGQPPRVHGVRDHDDALAKGARTIFERLPDGAEGVAVGLWQARGAEETITVAGDGARAKAAAKALRDARLVTLRIEGLAEAQAKRGAGASAEALASIDRLLGLALPNLPPDVMLVLVGGNAMAEAPRKPNSKGANDFAQLLEVPAGSLHSAGGVLRADALSAGQAAKLDEIPFTGLVLLNAQGTIQRWDADLSDVRPLIDADDPNAPDLALRVADALQPGEWLAVANRNQGFDFAVDGRPLGAAFEGGPGHSESQIALLFAGAGVDETLGRDLGPVSLDAIAPTIVSTLGGDTTGLPGKNLGSLLASAGGPDSGFIPDPRTPSRARIATELDAKAPKLAAWLRAAPPAVGLRFADAPDAAIPGNAADWLRVPEVAPDAATAARIAASLGAAVAVLADRAVASAPFIAGLGGPALIEVQLGADPATTVARVRAWSEALASMESGLFPAARVHLAAAAGLPEPYEGWRLLLDRWTLSQDPDDTEIEKLPKPADPWLARLDWLMGMESKRARSAVPAALPDDRLSPAQRRIEQAHALLKPLTPMESLCNPPDQQAADRAALAMGLYVEAGLVGHAALASATMANSLSDSARAADARETTLLLLAQPGARWAAVDATSRLLGTAALGRLMGRPVDDANLLKAQRLWLLELQRRIVADSGPGADDRNVARVATLLFNTLDTFDPLLRETLGVALGPDRARAGNVMGSLLLQGVLASVLGNQALPRIAAAMDLMAQTLGPWAELPVGELKPEQRAARAILPLTQAIAAVLTGNTSTAGERLAAAEALLTPQLVLDLRDASRDGKDTLAQWSPALLGTVYLAQVAFSAINGDKAAARRKTDALVDLAQGAAEREVRFHKRQADLGPKVSAVAAVVRASVALAFDARDDAPNTELIQKITAALQTVDLKVVAGANAEEDAQARVFTLVGVLAHDAAWLLANLQSEGATPPDAAALKPAEEALAALAKTWKPEGAFARTALLLGMAAQRALPAAPGLFADDDSNWIANLSRLKAVTEGLATLRTDIELAWPQAERIRSITEEGRLSALLLDLFRAVLDTDLARLSKDEDLDAVVRVLDARAAELLRGIGERTGNGATPLLGLLRAWLSEYQDEPDAAASFAEMAATRAEGTDLAPGRWMLWAHAARWRLMGNDPAGATRNLDRAAEACAGAGPYLDQLRAHLQINRTEGNRILDKARGELAARGLGPARFTLVVLATDADAEAKLNLDLDLKGLLLGGTGGSFQIGAGWNSNGNEDPVGARIELAGDGSSLDFVIDSLTVQAWDDLRANDIAATDRSLTRLADALFNQPDAGWFGHQPGPSLSGTPQGASLRNPDQLLWVASLAHAQGHQAASTRLFALLKELLPADLSSPREGSKDRCPKGKSEALAALPEDKRLARDTVCNMPKPLWRSLPPKAAAVVADLAHWHARELDGLKPDPKQLAAALKAGVKHGLVPAWRAGEGKKPKDFQDFDNALDPKTKDGPAAIAKVLAGPLKCQALWPLLTEKGVTGLALAVTAEACSAGHTRLVRLQELEAPQALQGMVGLARFLATTRRVPDGALLESIGRVMHLAAKADPALAIEQCASLADTLKKTTIADGAAFELNAMVLAARLRSGAPPGNLDDLLAIAAQGQAGSAPARKLVKTAAFRPGEAVALAKTFYQTP